MIAGWVSELLPVLDGMMGGVLLLFPLSFIDDLARPGPNRWFTAVICAVFLILGLFIAYSDALAIRYHRPWLRRVGRSMGCAVLALFVLAVFFAPNLH